MKPKQPKAITFMSYSNEPLIFQPKHFKAGVVDRTGPLDINPEHIKLCTSERHAKCLKDGGCMKGIGRGSWSEGKLLGVKSPCSWQWTPALERKYNKILKGWLDKCRGIMVTLEETK